MRWHEGAIEKLNAGQTVLVCPRGRSMEGRAGGSVSRSVLVTGGTGTLGASLVASLCESKFDVTANFWHDTARAEELQNRTGCRLARADVCDEASVEALFAARSYDAVVHCAGENQNSLLLQTSTELWDRALRNHLLSAFLITRAALRFLGVGAHLLLVASRVGERGGRGQSAYAAAKAGVLGLIRTAALEARESRICVNAICPGFASAATQGTISPAMLQARALENLLPDADAAQGFAAFVTWFLMQRPAINGQILRPDCRL